MFAHVIDETSDEKKWIQIFPKKISSQFDVADFTFATKFGAGAACASASAFFRGMKSTSAEGGAIIIKKVAETMMRTTNIHLVLVVFSVFL